MKDEAGCVDGGGRAGRDGCRVEELELGCDAFRPGGGGYDMMNTLPGSLFGEGETYDLDS